MKSVDLKILQYIRSNSRMNLSDMSRKTGIPVSTIYDRLTLQTNQCITRFTALLDFSKLGFNVRVNIFLKMNPQYRESIRHFLVAHERVNNLYRINNGYDYAAECIFASVKEVEEFLEYLDANFQVTDKHVFHIIDDLAREKAYAGSPFLLHAT